MTLRWTLALLLCACDRGSEPTQSTDLIPTGRPRPCGPLFSPSCIIREDKLCIDPGGYIYGDEQVWRGLESDRAWASTIPNPDPLTPWQCWTYVARMCGSGTYVHAGDFGARLINAEGFIEGRYFWSGDGWVEAPPPFSDACTSLYNGPLQHLDCVLAAHEEAQALASKCNLSRPCELSTCIVDEAP